MIFSSEQAGAEIVEWIKNHYQHPAGGVARGISQGQLSAERLFNDLGDYLPFMAALGERDWCFAELRAVQKTRRSDFLLPAEFKYFGQSCWRPYEHSDYLLGLLDLFTFWPSAELRADIISTLEKVWQTFFPQGRPHSWFFAEMNLRLPLADSRDGLFVEIFSDAAVVLEEKIWVERATQSADYFLGVMHKQNYPLLPEVSSWGGWQWLSRIFFRRASRQITMIKYNSNWWYALLALWRRTGLLKYANALQQIAETLERDWLDEAGALHGGQYAAGKKVFDKILLVHNFPVIDWAADCAYFLGNDVFRRLGRRVADFWCAQQNTTTGLVPLAPTSVATDMDNLTDLAVAWYKLAEVTGQEKYFFAAEKLIDGVWLYQRQPTEFCYAHSADIRTGKILDPSAKIKFVCLWLKVLLLKKDGGKIFTNEALWGLLRDR